MDKLRIDGVSLNGEHRAIWEWFETQIELLSRPDCGPAYEELSRLFRLWLWNY